MKDLIKQREELKEEQSDYYSKADDLKKEIIRVEQEIWKKQLMRVLRHMGGCVARLVDINDRYGRFVLKMDVDDETLSEVESEAWEIENQKEYVGNRSMIWDDNIIDWYMPGVLENDRREKAFILQVTPDNQYKSKEAVSEMVEALEEYDIGVVLSDRIKNVDRKAGFYSALSNLPSTST